MLSQRSGCTVGARLRRLRSTLAQSARTRACLAPRAPDKTATSIALTLPHVRSLDRSLRIGSLGAETASSEISIPQKNRVEAWSPRDMPDAAPAPAPKPARGSVFFGRGKAREGEPGDGASSSADAACSSSPARRSCGLAAENARDMKTTAQLNDKRLSSNKRMSIVAEAADEEIQSAKVVKVPWYIIMPFHTWKSNWDLTILMLVLVSGFLIPFDIAYRDELDPEECKGTTFNSSCGFGMMFDTVDLVLLCVFVVDLACSFFVSFQDEDAQWRITLKETSRNYVRTWLTIDLLAIIPFDQFASSEGAVLGMFKVRRGSGRRGGGGPVLKDRLGALGRRCESERDGGRLRSGRSTGAGAARV